MLVGGEEEEQSLPQQAVVVGEGEEEVQMHHHWVDQEVAVEEEGVVQLRVEREGQEAEEGAVHSFAQEAGAELPAERVLSVVSRAVGDAMAVLEAPAQMLAQTVRRATL